MKSSICSEFPVKQRREQCKALSVRKKDKNAVVHAEQHVGGDQRRELILIKGNGGNFSANGPSEGGYCKVMQKKRGKGEQGRT